MYPRIVNQGAAGASDWIVTDWRSHGNGLVAAFLDEAGAMTYKVQYTIDNLNAEPDQVSFSRTTTTLTVTDTAHGLKAGDYVALIDSDFIGTYTVQTAPSVDTYTLTVANSGATSGVAKRVKARVFDSTNITGKTADAWENISFPCRGVRVNVTAYTSGSVNLEYLHHLQK